MLIAGVLEVAAGRGRCAARRTCWPSFRWPQLDDDVRKFFRALGPATVGSAGVQLALFADTIIASFLAAGALSALYYADRLNQLPIGVIGIAVGTVLLPEMARRLAAGDDAGARHAQNRAIELTLLLSIPCVVAFLVVPELIMRALFHARRIHRRRCGRRRRRRLRPMRSGLIPFVLIRTMTAPFFARGDTATPVKAALTAVAVNVGFKIVLMGPLAQVGLALATSIGAWVNLGLVVWFAARAGILGTDARLKRSLAMLGVSGIVLAIALYLAPDQSPRWYDAMPVFRDEARCRARRDRRRSLCGVDTVLLGRHWLRGFLPTCGRPVRSPRAINPLQQRLSSARLPRLGGAGRSLKPKLFVPI